MPQHTCYEGRVTHTLKFLSSVWGGRELDNQRSGKVIMTTISDSNLLRRNQTAVGCWLFCWIMWDSMLAFLEYLSPKNFEILLVFSATGNSKKHTGMREKYTEKISVTNQNPGPWCRVVSSQQQICMYFLILHRWLIRLNKFSVLWMRY